METFVTRRLVKQGHGRETLLSQYDKWLSSKGDYVQSWWNRSYG